MNFIVTQGYGSKLVVTKGYGLYIFERVISRIRELISRRAVYTNVSRKSAITSIVRREDG